MQLEVEFPGLEFGDTSPKVLAAAVASLSGEDIELPNECSTRTTCACMSYIKTPNFQWQSLAVLPLENSHSLRSIA